MEIAFATDRLQQLCESAAKLRRKHGEGCAKKVQRRLSDLRAAETLADFEHLPGRCHELAGDREGQVALDLSDGKRLVFEPDHNPVPTKADGGLDRVSVTAVTIVEISDYH